MSRRRWIEVPITKEQTVQAGLMSGIVAVGAGVLTFYVTRMLLAREPLDAPPGRVGRIEPDDRVGGGA